MNFWLNILLLTVGLPWYSMAQPLLSGKQTVEGLVVYPDLEKPELFYYAPNDLELGRTSDGAPIFKLVQMRYTGTGLTGDQGDNRFLNLVQFRVVMLPVLQEQLQQVQHLLGGRRIQLRPLILRNVEAYLISALGEEYRRLGESGQFSSIGASENNESGYWRERTITLRLNKGDAQILWDQVAEGRLQLSISYAFYADVVVGESGLKGISRDTSLVSPIEKELEGVLALDSIPQTHLIKADAFTLNVDVQTFPDVLQKIDLNEEQRVSYPFLEVHCYDFANELRPDLGVKAIEMEAVSVRNQQLRLKKQRFFANQPGQSALEINFPFAVRLDRPLRYRVIELSRDGTEKTSDWITRDNWVGVIDITTAEGQIPYRRRLLELESPTAGFSESGIESLRVQIKYSYRSKVQLESIQFRPDDVVPLQQLSLLQDVDAVIELNPIWHLTNGQQQRGRSQSLLLDDYAFFPIPNQPKTQNR